MLKSYEALFDHGQIRWLESPPDVERARVIVTVLPASNRPERISSTDGVASQEVDQLLSRTASVWGQHTLNEVRTLMAIQCQADWGAS